jgi:hypothetical protein
MQRYINPNQWITCSHNPDYSPFIILIYYQQVVVGFDKHILYLVVYCYPNKPKQTFWEYTCFVSCLPVHVIVHTLLAHIIHCCNNKKVLWVSNPTQKYPMIRTRNLIKFDCMIELD